MYFSGKNVTLEYIFRESPETTKIIQQVPHLPMLLEVAMKTIATKPQMFSLTQLDHMCTQRHTYFAIPAEAAVEFDSVMDVLCAVNYTIVEQEMYSLLGIDPNNMGMVGTLSVQWFFSSDINISS